MDIREKRDRRIEKNGIMRTLINFFLAAYILDDVTEDMTYVGSVPHVYMFVVAET